MRRGVVAVAFAAAGCAANPASDAGPRVAGTKAALSPERGLSAPVALTAAGTLIDHGDAWGHTGPCLFDVDGDGRRDLLVGDFGGEFTLYKNVGSEKERRFAAGAKLRDDRGNAKVPIY